MKKAQSIEFTSTRNPQLRVGFWQSIVQGMAEDGGLLVPTNFPKLSPKYIQDKKWWTSKTPADFAYLIADLFVPESEPAKKEIRDSVKKAMDFDLPLEEVDAQRFVLRIDRGRTASFKDVAAKFLSVLMNAYAEKFSKKINIVVATSGDTGVAIADAFGNSKNITVTVLYPSYGVSSIQEKQMLEVEERYANEQVVPIDGNFDNCQDVAKLLQSARTLSKNDTKAKTEFKNACKSKIDFSVSDEEIDALIDTLSYVDLSSANSINIWRLLPQTIQYFYSYASLVKSGKIKAGESIAFAVPTGNAGHLMAGMYARELGLPVKKFIIGTNTNNILANVIGSAMIKHRPFAQSSSPSMDILDPSNMERLLHFSAVATSEKGKIDFDAMKADIKKMQDENIFEPVSKYGATEKTLEYLRTLFWAEDVETDQEVYAMMRHVAEEKKILLEPHGITAYIAVERAMSKGVIGKGDKVVIFETAHPDKFENALKASGTLKTKRYKHPILEKLKKINISKMKKPRTSKPDPMYVMKKIEELAGRFQKENFNLSIKKVSIMNRMFGP